MAAHRDEAPNETEHEEEEVSATVQEQEDSAHVAARKGNLARIKWVGMVYGGESKENLFYFYFLRFRQIHRDDGDIRGDDLWNKTPL